MTSSAPGMTSLAQDVEILRNSGMSSRAGDVIRLGWHQLEVIVKPSS